MRKSAGKAAFLAITLSLLGTVSTLAIEFDPCKRAEGQFNSTAEAMRSNQAAVLQKVTAWHEDPSTLPAELLEKYKLVVKDYAFKLWSESPAGKGTIESWALPAGDPAIKEKFLTFIYAKEITPEIETKLAHAVFQKDYEKNILPAVQANGEKIETELASGRKDLDDTCQPTVFNAVFGSTVGNLYMIISGNFEASKDESWGTAVIVRAITGVSIDDIFENGTLAGGENSELSKFNKAIFDVMDANGMGKDTVVGQIYTAANPLTWKIDIDVSDSTVAGQVVDTTGEALEDLRKSDLNPTNWKVPIDLPSIDIDLPW